MKRSNITNLWLASQLVLQISLLGCGKSLYAQNWNIATTFPGSYPQRLEATGISVGTDAYFGLGWDSNSNPTSLKDFWKYNTLTNTWSRLTDFPGTPRHYAFSFAIGPDIYIGGGYTAGTPAIANDFFIYHTATGSWSTAPNLPTDALYFGASFTLNGKGYVVCGSGYSNFSSNYIYCYDPVTTVWTRKSDLPGGPRVGPIGFAINGYGYVGGGTFTSCCQNSSSYNDFWQYNPSTDSWVQKNNINNGVSTTGYLAEAISLSDCSYGYAIGGYIDGAYTRTTLRYDPINDSWTTLVSLPASIQDGAGCIINGVSYAAFGLLNNIYSLNVYNTSINASPSPICSSSTLTLQSPPPFATSISWSSDNANALTVDATTANRQGSYNGAVTVSATVNTSCGTTQVYQANVWVGLPSADINTLIYANGHYGEDPVTLSSSNLYRFGCDPVSGDVTSFTWVLPSGFSFAGGSTTSSPRINTSATAGSYSLFCSANNSCGSAWTHDLGITIEEGGCIPPCPGPAGLSVYPNPASDNLTVSVTDSLSSSQNSYTLDQPYQLYLMDRFARKIFSIQSNEKKMELPASHFPPDIYYLNLIYKGAVLQRQIVIKR